MKKIKWEKRGFKNRIFATVGGLTLRCLSHLTNSGKITWCAEVYITGRRMPGVVKIGEIRHSLVKAQEDAGPLACEFLLDYKAGLDAELKNFDLVEQEV